MNKLILLAFCVILSLQLRGQDSALQDKVTMKTGEVYVGKIILKTNELLMITTANGQRYQFLLSEVKNVDLAQNVGFNITEIIRAYGPHQTENFAAMLDVSAGLAFARYSFDWSPAMQFSLVFGNKKVFDKRFFVGAGLGYSVILDKNSINATTFLPLFVRFQSTLSDHRTAPYVGIDAGYGFALNEGNKGGELLKVNFGLVRRISYKSVFSVAIYAGVQAYNTQLIEANQYGTFSYYGKTSVTDLGCKMSLQF